MVAALGSGYKSWFLSAWLSRGNSVVIGTSASRESPKFVRRYKDGSVAYCAHAEMDCINKATSKFGSLKGMDLHVVRFYKDGLPACSKPCIYCMKHIMAAGIRYVYYVDENGQQCKLRVRSIDKNVVNSLSYEHRYSY